ncbi:MAG TPA: DUF692 domain-containing protein [Xanthobacteraceae bacterium]
MTAGRGQPAVGIAYRAAIGQWTLDHISHFDVLEITVDHCMDRKRAVCSAIYDLVGRIPLTAHGVGLSIGTDAPLDERYLDRVAEIIDRLKPSAYSEHLAFTRVPGRDLATLLPVPKTEAVADSIIAKVRRIQSCVPVPFLLENISYLFDWPDSTLSDADFLNLICRGAGAGLLLDIENLFLNSRNHEFDAYEFLDSLTAGIVKEVHLAGGITVDEDFLARPWLIDSHSHPVPDETLDLLEYALVRHSPANIIVEREDRLDAACELLDDVARIRSRVTRLGLIHR